MDSEVMRPAIQYVKRNLDGPLIGAEIGVYEGDNAHDILKNIPRVKHLYLVDPYTGDYWLFKPAYAKTIPPAKQKAYNKIKGYTDKTTWIYECFEASLIPEKLDFIYIDACHHYDCVSHDIREAEKIIKVGSVIGGHDYYPEGVNEHRFGVGRAVRERYGDSLHHKGTDWWVVIG